LPHPPSLIPPPPTTSHPISSHPTSHRLPQDEELFDDNPFEYVRRDVEGSDTDTRRRVSCDLVRALCRNYEQQITTRPWRTLDPSTSGLPSLLVCWLAVGGPAALTQRHDGSSLASAVFSGYIGSLLSQAAASPANWKAKDAAVYLVIALTVRGASLHIHASPSTPPLPPFTPPFTPPFAPPFTPPFAPRLASQVRGTTAKLGATQTNTLINPMDFYASTVLPELQAASAGGGSAHPILLADALKFVTVFRAQLSAEVRSPSPRLTYPELTQPDLLH
jgi:exportin-2 (importin alpha re-exporter)